jgi:predicted alpha-1,2-mannosidase
LVTAALVAGSAVGATSASAAIAYVAEPAAYVNTLAGTGSGGTSVGSINNFPGAAAPFGMMQFSPDIPDSGAGYYYNTGTSTLRGFSLNHASQGCGAFGDFPILPTTVDPTTGTPWTRLNTFDHSDEVGEPGYYRLASTDAAGARITSELTATTRSGMASFTFPASATPAVTFRSGVSNGSTVKGSLNVNPSNRTISGWTVNSRFCGQKNQYRVYFTATFEQPFTSYGAWNESSGAITNKTVGTDTTDAEISGIAKAGGYVRFAAGTTTVRLKLAMSYVKTGDLALGTADPTSGYHGGSALNLATEIPTADYGAPGTTPFADYASAFTAIRQQTRAEWNDLLGRVQVPASAAADELKTFYHALYRTLLHPNVLEDVTGQYPGFEYFAFVAPGSSGTETQPRIHSLADANAAAGLHQQHVYANFSDWDTYRSWAPLIATLFPKVASDIAQTYVLNAEQSGQFPRWAMVNASTDQMSGDNASALIAQVYAYGARDFDVSRALHYMYQSALGATAGTYTGGQNPDQINRPAAADYAQRHYAAQLPEHQTDHAVTGASVTEEWSIDDFAISQFADALSPSQIAAAEVPANVATVFAERTNYWQNLLNPLTMCLSPRDYAGRFPVGSDCNSTPADFGYRGHVTGFGQVGFDEASSEQYLWMVPQNLSGLITALGGRAATAERLDAFMTGGYNVGANDPRMWIGNEPSFATPWVYNYLGRPWRTQEVVEAIRTRLFGHAPNGAEPGNDDLGAQSSWYVWAALGVYPATPGTDILTVNSPTFEKAVVHLGDGSTLTLTADHADDDRYVAGLSVNGTAQSATWLADGWRGSDTSLDFTMSATPTQWGTAPADAPPSFTTGSAATVAYADPVTIAPGSQGTITLAVQRIASVAASYTVDDSAVPSGITVTSQKTRFDSTGHSAQQLTVAVGAGVADQDAVFPLTVVTSSGERSRVDVTVRVARANSFLMVASLQTRSRQAAHHVAFDGYNGYIREQLTAAGLPIGTSFDLGEVSGASTLSGLSATLPDVSEGLPDTIVPKGQKVNLSGSPTRISFVGAAKSANTSGTAVVTLDDGSTGVANLSFGDWVLPSSSGTASTGTLAPYSTNIKLVWTPTRFGQSSDPGAYVYATAPYTAPAGRTIVSVTLTGSATDNRRVFAIAQNTVPTSASVPTQTLGAAQVTAGGSLTVTGAGFAAGEVVKARLDGAVLATRTADNAGAVAITVTIPRLTTAGKHSVRLVGESSGGAAVSELVVAAATWNPKLTTAAKVEAGSQVVITGTGFGASEPVQVTLGEASVAIHASASGEITTSLPAPSASGTVTVSATGGLSAAHVTSTVRVVPLGELGTELALSVSQGTTVFGSSVTIVARVDADLTGQVEFRDGSRVLGSASLADRSARLTVANLGAGNHPISARLASEGLSSTTVNVAVIKAATGGVRVSASPYRKARTAKVKVVVAPLTNGRQPDGWVRLFVGSKPAVTARLTTSAKGVLTVTLGKAYTKAKTITVKANFVPADSADVLSAWSDPVVVKRR